jgi:hypothetical protein
MQSQTFRSRALALLIGAAALLFSGWAAADPPSRVARLGYISGAISFSPAGEDDWVRASVNRPLTTGDRLWADARGRAEIQVGPGLIRIDAGTGLSILNLDDRIVQLQLTQGTMHVRVRRLAVGEIFEVDTPNLAFTLREPGEYRISVDPAGDATAIFMRRGRGEAYGDGAAYAIGAGRGYRFTGTGLGQFQQLDVMALDDFERWAGERDRAWDTSVSARYVSQDVLGYVDLDVNGAWRVDATYGNIWFPSRVSSGWAPYRDGHWAWVDPWGWTWVDDAPWGFAVSHYGRWAHVGDQWGWVPGPRSAAAWYAPALVVFLGGDNFQLTISTGNVGGVGWFPLGPREVYRPAYPVSLGYFQNINRSNTVINTTVINNYYNNTNVTNIVYANRQVPGAVVAVPTAAFVQSQPVSAAAVPVSREAIQGRPVAVAPPVAPTERSVRGSAAAGDKPPAKVFERPVVARTAPPPPHVGFAAQQPQLVAKPGHPLDEDARKQLKREPSAPAPTVKVVPPAQVAVPTQRPRLAAPEAAAPAPAPAPAARARPVEPAPQKKATPQERERASEREQAAPAPAPAPARVAPAERAAQPRVAAPAPAARQPEARPQAPAAAAARPEPQAQPREREAKPEPQAQPRAREAKPEPQAQPRAREAKPEPQAQPRGREAKPEPQAEPRGREARPAASKPKGRDDEERK